MNPLPQFKEGDREENEIGVGERCSLQSKLPAAQSYLGMESTKTLTLFLKEFGEQLLRDLPGEDPRRRGGSFLEET